MKMTTVVVMQPTFLPWLGYFDLIDQADVFVFYNDVQFVKQSWLSRNRLNGPNGVFYLNCPVKKNAIGATISETLIDNSQPWRKKILKTLFYTYQKSMFFEEVHSWMIDFFELQFDRLDSQNIGFIKKLNERIGLDTPLKLSSELNLRSEDRIDKLIEICMYNRANRYLSTPGAKVYMSVEQGQRRMQEADIEMLYHNYELEPYQVSLSNYEPYMSIIDMLYNVGFDKALHNIRKGRRDSGLSVNK